jgi:SPP1 family predicted phage head-tail adaptor
MNPGSLDTKITLQTKTETKTASGAVSVSWSEDAQPWAEIIDQGAREYSAAAAVHSGMTSLIRIRFRSGITPRAARVIMRGETNEVIGAVIEGRNVSMLLSLQSLEGRA